MSKGYRYCECECDCDDAPELSSEGKIALLRALASAEDLRRAVPAWAVIEAEWLLTDLELVAAQVGLESAGAKAQKAALADREKREAEKAKAERERLAYVNLASVLGVPA